MIYLSLRKAVTLEVEANLEVKVVVITDVGDFGLLF